jgi:chaperonin GroEL (HSP60 family)
LCQALTYAGFAGRIILEKSETSDSIEVMKGYTFEGLKPQWDMNLHLKNCRILCIDGLIESASEIHNFLSSSAESSEYVVMFIRGLSQDVLNTIKVNFDRGTIRVLPVIVPFDILGINMINDISIVSGCDLKTSLKGDQITTLSLVDSSVIEEIIITSSKITIINRKTNYSVSAHTKVLLEKREKEKVDDAIELIDKRLRALSPNHVVIRLLNDHNWTSRVQSFDYTLRAIKSLNEHGTLCIDNKKQLTSTFIASELCSVQCVKELRKIGYLLI